MTVYQIWKPGPTNEAVPGWRPSPRAATAGFPGVFGIVPRRRYSGRNALTLLGRFEGTADTLPAERACQSIVRGTMISTTDGKEQEHQVFNLAPIRAAAPFPLSRSPASTEYLPYLEQPG